MIRLVTPSAAATVLPLVTLKAHLRVTHAAEDAILGIYAGAAVRAIEARLGRSLGPATYSVTLGTVPPVIDITIPNVIAIAAMTIIDRDGIEQTIAEGDRLLVTGDVTSTVEPADGVTWPAAASVWNACELTVTAGYDSGALPPDIQAALLLMATALYRGRGDAEMPAGAASLIAPYRIAGWM